jgi:alkylresorcinol/alkylpyrone synthase
VTTLAAVYGCVPPHRYRQDELTELFTDLCVGADEHSDLLRRLHRNARVETRHLALPAERYRTLRDFGEANAAFLEVATQLGADAVCGALEQARVRPEDVDMIMSTTVTGIAVPSIEARIADRIGLRPDVKRVPLFGLGCVAGAAGIARMDDYLRGWPDHVAVLLSVELCSLTVQRDDCSTANLVASGLFGDGAAAVVAVGAAKADRYCTGPEVLAARSHLYPDTPRTMGWDAGPGGLKIVLDAQVPGLVRRFLADDIRDLLRSHGLGVSDVGAWISHPGGPKVIEAIELELDLPPQALELTWRSLADVGNLSSASVLHVLRDTIAQRLPEPGTHAVLMAMGPGFCSESVLLRW